MRPRRLIAACGLLAAAAVAGASADPVEDAFRRGCLERERPELRGTDTWPWIEELCAREGAGRATSFRAAGREGRLGLLAEECADWYARNRERLAMTLRDDARARRAYVTFVCRMEAEERLPGMGP